MLVLSVKDGRCKSMCVDQPHHQSNLSALVDVMVNNHVANVSQAEHRNVVSMTSTAKG